MLQRVTHRRGDKGMVVGSAAAAGPEREKKLQWGRGRGAWSWNELLAKPADCNLLIQWGKINLSYPLEQKKISPGQWHLYMPPPKVSCSTVGSHGLVLYSSPQAAVSEALPPPAGMPFICWEKQENRAKPFSCHKTLVGVLWAGCCLLPRFPLIRVEITWTAA